jgi:transcription-repair coupling factor (superfamily II helicase)
MPSIYSYLNRGLEIEQIKAAMAKKESPQMIFHTTGSIKAALTSGLIKKDGQCLIITYSEEQAHKWASDIRAWLPLRSVLIYPATEWLPFEVLGRSRETTAERIKVLRTLLEDNNQIIIAPVQAIARKLFSPQHWKKYSLHIIAGKTYSLQELIKILVTAGYERQEIVEAKGQFALRGGILDIAPLDCAPVRIEFFDEEVDSIRIFDLETQKSSDTITEAFVFPVQEYVIGTEEQQELKWEIKDKARRAVGRLQRLGKKEAVKRLHRKVDYLEERLEQGIMDENSYPFLSLLPIKFVSLLDWFKDNALIILDEPLRIKEQLDFQNSQRQEEYTANLEKGEEFVEPEKIFLQFEDIANSYREKMIIGMANLFREIPGFLPRKVHNINARLIAHFNKTSMLVEEIKKMIAVGDTIALFAGNRDQAQRLTQGLKDSGIESRIREL